ncbi:hypothetical protein D3C75_1248020 [compost metagenome]
MKAILAPVAVPLISITAEDIRPTFRDPVVDAVASSTKVSTVDPNKGTLFRPSHPKPTPLVITNLLICYYVGV